jgi:hypothetical protein
MQAIICACIFILKKTQLADNLTIAIIVLWHEKKHIKI